MLEITKTILRLICDISAITLHLYYFLADGEHSFGEGWEEDWREGRECLSIYITILRMVEVRLERAGKRIGERRSVMSLHLYYYPADGGGSFGEGGREDWREEVEE